MFRSCISITLVIVIIAGCSGNKSKPPSYTVSSRPNEKVIDSPSALPEVRSVMVKDGDTIYSIAKRYGVTPRDVIEKNNLVAPFKIIVGQNLSVPRPAIHFVSAGDTVFSLSQRYGVDMRTLVAMNQLKAPFQLKRGQVLRIPGRERDFGGTKRLTQTIGRKIEKFSKSNRWPIPKPRPPSILKRASRIEGNRVNQVLSVPERRGGKLFLWPVRGRVISKFGPRVGGLHNDGINIAAPRGAPIYAADNGIVAYTGTGIKGFGNLVLVKHAGGWTTAYAHVDRVLVQRGDRVKRGETIGTIGSTGKVTRPQLHFEIRKGSRAVNPIKELAI